MSWFLEFLSVAVQWHRPQNFQQFVEQLSLMERWSSAPDPLIWNPGQVPSIWACRLSSLNGQWRIRSKLQINFCLKDLQEHNFKTNIEVTTTICEIAPQSSTLCSGLCELCPLKPVSLSVPDPTRCNTLMNTETDNQKLLVKLVQKLFRLVV